VTEGDRTWESTRAPVVSWAVATVGWAVFLEGVGVLDPKRWWPDWLGFAGLILYWTLWAALGIFAAVQAVRVHFWSRSRIVAWLAPIAFLCAITVQVRACS